MSQTNLSQPTGLQQPEKRDWIPIIVGAIVALLGGGILASIFNSLISYVTAPYIQVLITPDSKHDGNKATILMVNIGGTAAKHVRLTVKAPEEIIGYNGFNTENMSLQQQKTTPRVLQADIPRLVQGNGSLVNISLMIKAKPNIILHLLPMTRVVILEGICLNRLNMDIILFYLAHTLERLLEPFIT